MTTLATYAVAPREEVAVVRATPSALRTRVCELGSALEAEMFDVGTPVLRPHLDAAMVAQMLAFAPYVSVALRAHTLCVEAITRDLRTTGFTWAELNDLAGALQEVLWGAGLRLQDGTWQVSAEDRASRAALPSVADLAFDVGDSLEVVED